MTRLYQLLYVVAFSLTVVSCNENDLSPGENGQSGKACNVNEPAKELSWLRQIIRKAEDPQTKGEYAGTIHLVRYEDQVYIIYQKYHMSCMACLGYDCEGNQVDIISDPEKHMGIIEQMSQKTVIYRSAFE